MARGPSRDCPKPVMGGEGAAKAPRRLGRPLEVRSQEFLKGDSLWMIC
jgi:hypothetical protein